MDNDVDATFLCRQRLCHVSHCRFSSPPPSMPSYTSRHWSSLRFSLLSSTFRAIVLRPRPRCLALTRYSHTVPSPTSTTIPFSSSMPGSGRSSTSKFPVNVVHYMSPLAPHLRIAFTLPSHSAQVCMALAPLSTRHSQACSSRELALGGGPTVMTACEPIAMPTTSPYPL
jgi:hypothetical protein